MKRSELINLVEQIQTSTGNEEEVNKLVQVFLNNVPDPSGLDYLFGKEYEHLKSEEIVDKALNYKPFYL